MERCKKIVEKCSKVDESSSFGSVKVKKKGAVSSADIANLADAISKDPKLMRDLITGYGSGAIKDLNKKDQATSKVKLGLEFSFNRDNDDLEVKAVW